MSKENNFQLRRMVLKEQNLRKERMEQSQWIQRRTQIQMILSGDLKEIVNHHDGLIIELGNPLITAVKSFFQGLSTAWEEVIREEPVQPPALTE